MTDQPNIPFLDVPLLLESSQPRARQHWFWYFAGAFVLLVLLSATLSGRSPEMAAAVRVMSGVLMFVAVGVMAAITVLTVRRARAEQVQLEAIEELVTLRRWPQAAVLLEAILSRPMRTPHGRVQGLIYLAGVLARYHRFDDAIAVQSHLLETIDLDPSTSHALRLGRTMAMLREDHLFDADRAINDLRRRISRAGAPPEDEQPASDSAAAADATDDAGVMPTSALPQMPESAGLALIEIYRDVKTGHPGEAIEIFQAKLAALRQQLGHRVADAYVLAARAYDLLGRTAEAQDAFEKATLLAPLPELARRYPEVQPLLTKYQPTPAPAEAA